RSDLVHNTTLRCFVVASHEAKEEKAKQSSKEGTGGTAEKSKSTREGGGHCAEDAGGGGKDDDDATVCKWRQRSTGGVRERLTCQRIVCVGQTDVGERGQSTTEDESESLSTPPQAGPLKSLNAADFLAAAIRSKCGKGDREDGRRSARFSGEGPTAGRLEEVDDSMVLLLGLAGAAVPAANPVAQARDSAGQGKLILALGPRNRRAAAS
ncbi:hypothetical protein MUK42_10902, partial [Musa troglodytarum]